jgi:hypothetical protein
MPSNSVFDNIPGAVGSDNYLFSGEGISWLLDNKQAIESELNNLIKSVQAGTGNPLELQALLAKIGYNISPEFEKWLDNMISVWNTKQSQQFQLDARDTSYLSTAEQLEALGLSGSNVLQAGGASLDPTATATNTHYNTADARASRDIQRTTAMIRMVSGLASAGIGGGALLASRNAAAKSAQAAAKATVKASVPQKVKQVTADDFARKNGYSSFAEMQRIAKTPWLDPDSY